MAEKRMFAKTIIDSDAFLDMPLSTQALYFHLSMRADDEGFVNNPKKIQRVIGASDDDLKILFSKKFILVFENGVIVIKHWKLHNCIRKDRLKQSVYTDERELLYLDENNSYTLEKTNKKLSDTSSNSKELSNENNEVLSLPNNENATVDNINNIPNIKLFEILGFGTVNIVNQTDIEILEEEYTEAWVRDALKEASEQGVKNLKYVRGILKNWQTSGRDSKPKGEETKQKELTLEEQILEKVSDFDFNNKPIGIIKAIIYNWINLYSIDSIYAAIEQCKSEDKKTMKRVKEILEG